MRKLAYNVDEAADMLGISRRLLYEYIKTGQLASVKLGTRRLVRYVDLSQFVESLEAA